MKGRVLSLGKYYSFLNFFENIFSLVLLYSYCKEEIKKMEYQGWNLAHYAFSKDALKPTVYYDETLDCTL